MFKRVLNNFSTIEVAEEFDKRIQNSAELVFINDKLLRSLLDTLEDEESRRIEQGILTTKIVEWIKKRKGKQDELSL
jgi:uncharacterized membrane-anchored protein